MKLRINGNSLRLRVGRSEVERLLRQERLEESIQFAPQPDARLTYALEQTPSVSVPTIRYTEREVTVLLPSGLAETWCGTDMVGISERVGLGTFGTLDLLIEK